MVKLLFATNNVHKVSEIQSGIGDIIEVISLHDAGISIEIEEPYNTLEENAIEKALTIHKLACSNCFSEDSGLEVEALNGEPGARSARYAGEDCDHTRNISKLLESLKGNDNRRARFRTIICLIWEEDQFLFEGICDGTISETKKGKLGFGYDPIFVPEGTMNSFAEMGLSEKNKYSHRKKAADMMVLFLQQKIGSLTSHNPLKFL